jgi:hypothetical protein
MCVVPGSGRLVAVVLAAIAVAMLAVAARADAFVYWASPGTVSGAAYGQLDRAGQPCGRLGRQQ